MTLRAAVWKSDFGGWIVDVCHGEEYRYGARIECRAYDTTGWHTRGFPTHAEAIAYAHDITHKEHHGAQ